MKTCKKGLHQYEGGLCVECRKGSLAAYYAANAEKRKASSAAWRKANPERAKASSATYRTKNPEKVKASNVAHYVANKEKIKASSAAWVKSNKERAKASKAAWREANPERVKAFGMRYEAINPDAHRVRSSNRRALKRAAGGKLSKGLAARLFVLQKGICPCCFEPLGEDYHLDHIVPLSLGGSNTDDNIQLMRARCNLRKGNKHPDAWARERGSSI